jgi:hypothetical protein
VRILHLELTDPDFSESVSQHSRKLLAAISGQIASAIAHGQINISCNPDQLAESVYTTFNGAMITAAIDGEPPSCVWIIERLQRTIAPHRST